jgi:hypothetical protein
MLAVSCVNSTAADWIEQPENQTKQKEVWSNEDAASIFAANLEYRLEALPMSGEAAQIPWAGSYWPTFQDSINYKWAGPSSDSASKKYERAFGGSGVEDAVSRYHGLESQSRTCQTTTECHPESGETCARREGADTGRCIGTWWGICNAWSAAAILFPEPKDPVTRNGITFQPQDLKALGSLVHDSTRKKVVSLRCNEPNTIAYDPYGRPTDEYRACRDTNAGTYHLLITNYLGVMHQSFVEDRTFSYQVWNQPLRGFQVTSKRELTFREANDLVGGGAVVADAGSAYQFNPNAAKFYDVSMTVTYIYESGPADGYTAPNIDRYTGSDSYRYVLELDANGKIIGGEWVGSSKQAHPDFLWLPLGPNDNSGAGGAINYDVVRELLFESASVSADGGTGGGGNGGPRDVTERATLAKDEWRHLDPYATGADTITVEMTGTGDADLYVRMGGQPSAALYDCRPYTGDSTESCTLSGPGPLYVSVNGYTAASVSVRIRFTGDTTPPPAQHLDESGAVALGELQMFQVPVTAGRKIFIRTTAPNDVDLYVKMRSAPSTSTYDQRGYTNSGNETLSLVPSVDGTLFIGVHGYAASSFTLKTADQ